MWFMCFFRLSAARDCYFCFVFLLVGCVRIDHGQDEEIYNDERRKRDKMDDKCNELERSK